MSTTRRVAAIVPAYNEEETLAEVLAVLKATPLLDEVIVVSDGSTDETVAIARGMKLKTIHLRENHGTGTAMGANGAKKSAGDFDAASDPFHMFSELNGRGRWRPGPGAQQPKAETRKVMNAERKALQVMGLAAGATLVEVKMKYKALVKQHHPDANGGDRSTEDRLIEIIKAYNYLKTVVKEA